jgi:hypothetical protein
MHAKPRLNLWISTTLAEDRLVESFMVSLLFLWLAQNMFAPLHQLENFVQLKTHLRRFDQKLVNAFV